MAESSDVAIATFLDAEGFTDAAAQAIARGVLEAEGLTRPGKQRMALTKVEPAREALAGRLARACAECRAPGEAAAGGRTLVEVATEACPFCRGSTNRRAMAELALACARAGARRVLVVGGTPILHETLVQLAQEAGAAIAFRFVEATERVRTKDEAGVDLRWADVAVIWAPSPLPHKVSNLYTEHPETKRLKPAVCHQRGIAALCATLVQRLGRG